MRYRLAAVVIFAFVCLLTSVVLMDCRRDSGPARPTITSTAATVLSLAPTEAPTTVPTATQTVVAIASPARPTTATASRAQAVVRAKIEIVWPHEGASVEDADRANVTAYLIAGDGRGNASGGLNSVPCDFDSRVWLWAALNSEPARQVGVGQKRMITGGGRTFPAWDFNDVSVAAARDPADKISFFATVDGVSTLHNIWSHAADARTLFPQPDVPVGATRQQPSVVDARIQIVWPKDGLPVQEAPTANITAYLFDTGTLEAISPDATWSPTVRLHWSLNNETELAPGQGLVGERRTIHGANGIAFLAWDFNDVDVSSANDSLNRIYFWLSVDEVPTRSNVWAHGVDARTLFPQPEVLNSCR